MKRLVAASLLLAATATAQPVDERALHDARARGSINELEALGQRRPIGPWTDDAWRSAAQLAERAGDYARAQRDLEQALTTTDDEQLIRRTRADIDRLAGVSRWTIVADAHDKLVQRLEQPGDPSPALRELERLITTNPEYPRRIAAILTLARGLEREGQPSQALHWLRDAAAVDTSTRSKAELARVLIRHGALDDAANVIAGIEDRGLAQQLRELLERARSRRTWRRLAIAALAVCVVLAVIALRGRWRRVARPPTEVLFLAPAAIVLVAIAQTSNPLIAAAVRTIALAGLVVSWLTGASLTARRVTLRIALVHAVVASLSLACAVFLALERDRTLDLVIETWRSGPALR